MVECGDVANVLDRTGEGVEPSVDVTGVRVGKDLGHIRRHVVGGCLRS